jgi:hypothetical protein
LDEHRVEGVCGSQAVSSPDAQPGPGCARRLIADRNKGVGIPVRVEQDQGGQELGERSRCAPDVEVAAP